MISNFLWQKVEESLAKKNFLIVEKQQNALFVPKQGHGSRPSSCAGEDLLLQEEEKEEMDPGKQHQ